MLTTILLMACVTFVSRYLFLHRALPFTVGQKLQQFLSYSAPAVLTAIWVPIVLLEDGALNLTWHNPYIPAAIVAIAVAAKTNNIYYTSLAGLAVFFLLR
ncbi:hypothetical protein PULV_a2479 [Pseudoalteromonas ulvae UL12]|uniref:AzlD domain-containing protein n=1 Tax=Pseudoalteromonas ulvae TaxID=107327 RepID=UPI00186B596D|nr:AzlD domain-containing protein [Pseudoalteromonas ulvae]MBE0364724.1 hypothetical protein [Pseudoalteromonas ulvae UL12]